MARLDKQTPSKMAGHQNSGSTYQPPNHPQPQQHHHSAATYTHPAAPAAAAATTPPTAQEGNHARVRSYDSFKRIIEGPTYHPCHSRESSQASTGSGDNRSPRKSGHSHTGSRDSANSLTPGKTPPQYYSPGKASNAAHGETFINGGNGNPGYVEYGQPGNSRQEQNSYTQIPRYQGSGYPRTETVPPKPVNLQVNRDTYSNYHQPKAGPRVFNENDLSNKFEGDLPSVHQTRRDGSGDISYPYPPPPAIPERQGYRHPPSYHSHLRTHPRPEPDGEDSNSAPHPTHDPPPYHSNHHRQHHHTRISDRPRETSPSRTSRPRLQRQHGVHVTEEVPVAYKPRPKTEYLDRTGVYEEPPVLMRDRTGRDVIGYVNSAFIEEISPDLGLSHGGNGRSSSPKDVTPEQRHHHHQEQSENSISNAHNYTRPSSNMPMGSESQGYEPSSHTVRVQVEGPFQRDPMKKTVGEARQEKEEQVQMRRHYVQHKHRSDANRQHSENTNRFRFSHLGLESNSHSRPYVRVSSPVQLQNSDIKSTNAAKPMSSSVAKRSSQPPLRPLSVSPDRKRQRRFNQSEIQHSGVQPEVGLQSFVQRDADSKSSEAAIMVHMVPPSERERKTSGTTSPVIINVGEMTWERLKRQVSKKNVYVVQQKEEVKVTTESSSRSHSKPRTHFTLSLFTMCFCLSPLGFIAMIFAVCSASAYKDKQPDSGRCLSKVALVLSIIGIIGSLATAAILIWTNTLPMIGRYSEPEGN